MSEELNDELKKLEISKLDRFLSMKGKDECINGSESDSFLKTSGDLLFSESKCGCRMNRNSLFTIIDSENLKLPRPPMTQTTFSQQRSILHQKTFKPKKRTILRESSLIKSFRGSFQYKSTRKISPNNAESIASNEFSNVSDLAPISTEMEDLFDLNEHCKSLGHDHTQKRDLREVKNISPRQNQMSRSYLISKFVNCPSCSQQARITNKNGQDVGNNNTGNLEEKCNNEDDVTIDELASYFETFVHIPKKMSSMAEMMYI